MTQNANLWHDLYAVKVGLTPATYEKLRFVSETLGMDPLRSQRWLRASTPQPPISFNVAEKSSNQAIEAMVPHMAQLFQSPSRTRSNKHADSSRHPTCAATVLGGGTNRKTGEVIPRPVLQIETTDERGLVEMHTITVPTVEGFGDKVGKLVKCLPQLWALI